MESLSEDRLSISVKSRELLFSRRRYPVLYALLCPFSNEPIIAIARVGKYAFPKDGLKTRNYVEDNGHFAVATADYGDRCCQTVAGTDTIVRYFFGRPLSALLTDAFEHVIAESSRKLSFARFEEAVIKGTHQSVRIGKELIEGKDPIIAVICD